MIILRSSVEREFFFFLQGARLTSMKGVLESPRTPFLQFCFVYVVVFVFVRCGSWEGLARMGLGCLLVAPRSEQGGGFRRGGPHRKLRFVETSGTPALRAGNSKSGGDRKREGELRRRRGRFLVGGDFVADSGPGNGR